MLDQIDQQIAAHQQCIDMLQEMRRGAIARSMLPGAKSAAPITIAVNGDATITISQGDNRISYNWRQLDNLDMLTPMQQSQITLAPNLPIHERILIQRKFDL